MPITDVGAAAKAINGIVAPAIMISASALMILALHAKYSSLIDRLRSLNEERRSIVNAPEQQKSGQRLQNVVEQIELFLVRARLVRNSIVSLYLAISLFVLSSIIIGVAIVISSIGLPIGASLIVFMLGMVCVFIGTVYALRDILNAYTIARIEVRGAKGLSRTP